MVQIPNTCSDLNPRHCPISYTLAAPVKPQPAVSSTSEEVGQAGSLSLLLNQLVPFLPTRGIAEVVGPVMFIDICGDLLPRYPSRVVAAFGELSDSSFKQTDLSVHTCVNRGNLS